MKKKYLAYAALIVLSLLAAMKMMILGMNIDEEYAVTMGYRMALGDRMFLEMWEPHQMSGFVCAFFIKIFMMITHTNTYLVLYLRGIGVLIQFSLSVFAYKTLKKKYSGELSFWAALIIFNALPKWTLVPDFSNLLLWCSLGTMLCLFRFSLEEKKKGFWLVLGALFYCGAVLCYPSALIMFPVYFLGLWKLTKKEERRKIWIFPGICGVTGAAYVLYFLLHMSAEQFINGIGQMMTDTEHTYTIMDRLWAYGTELAGFLIPLAIVLLPSWLVGKFLGKKAFGGALIFLSVLEQMVYWLGDGLYLNQPLLFFFTVYAVGFLFVKKDNALLWFGILPSGAALLAVLILTNTMIGVSGMQLLPGMICAGLFLGEVLKEEEEKLLQRWIPKIGLLSLLALFLFAKGWLVCESGGFKADATFVKQKALYGPAKNIYCGYLDGYGYNKLWETLENVIDSEDSILYVGKHSLRYLLFDAKISMYSTISTPTFDERLLEYWQEYPDRYPTVVITEPGQDDFENIKGYFDFKEETLESENMIIYFVDRKEE